VGTAGLDAVPAAVIAASAAWLTMQAIDRRTQPSPAPQVSSDDARAGR
jgi:hypothetical protein